MKQLVMLPEAEAEMLDAASFYGKQQRALRLRFLSAVQDALTRIQINPILYPLLEAKVRRCLTKTCTGYPDTGNNAPSSGPGILETEITLSLMALTR